MVNGCGELEKEYSSSDNKCAKYNKSFPGCQCEAHTVSDFSPGPVGNEEWLIRTIYSPIHLNDETGGINPAAFGDVKSRGLSVNRMGYISQDQLKERIEDKIKKDIAAGRNRDGKWCVIAVSCNSVRGLLSDDQRRLFCVYDSAAESNASHADICQALEVGAKHHQKKFRQILRECFGYQPETLAAAYATYVSNVP